jgi:hypothetical protein
MILIRLTETDDERAAVARLVHDRYVRRRFIDPQPSGMFSCEWPNARVFVAIEGEKLEGTLTLVPDGPSGLPCDTVFRDLARQVPEPVCQFVSLATTSGEVKRQRVILPLMTYVREYAATSWRSAVMIVRPSHVKFYERYFLAKRLGSRKYAQYRMKDAWALAVDLRKEA